MPLVTRTTSNANLFKQDTEPGNKENGNVWMDTSADPPILRTANGTTYELQSIIIGTTTLRLDIAIFALG